MNELPDDPMTSLAEGATEMHEYYLSLMSAGFTPSEALEVVIAVVREAVRMNGPGSS